MPAGSRTERSPLDGRRWYYANDSSAAVPQGLGDEDAIRAIWEEIGPDSASPHPVEKHNLNTVAAGPPQEMRGNFSQQEPPAAAI